MNDSNENEPDTPEESPAGDLPGEIEAQVPFDAVLKVMHRLGREIARDVGPQAVVVHLGVHRGPANSTAVLQAEAAVGVMEKIAAEETVATKRVKRTPTTHDVWMPAQELLLCGVKKRIG